MRLTATKKTPRDNCGQTTVVFGLSSSCDAMPFCFSANRQRCLSEAEMCLTCQHIGRSIIADRQRCGDISGDRKHCKNDSAGIQWSVVLVGTAISPVMTTRCSRKHALSMRQPSARFPESQQPRKYQTKSRTVAREREELPPATGVGYGVGGGG